MDIIPDKDGCWWNAGHFAYAVDRAKEKGSAGPGRDMAYNTKRGILDAL